MSLFLKTANYSEVIRPEQLWYDGVDVFCNDNRKFIKKINYKLGFKISYNKIKNADLFLIFGKTHKFKIAVYNLTNELKIVSFLSGIQFYKATSNNYIQKCNNKNNELLKQWVVNKINNEKSTANIIYSNDFYHRVILENVNKMVVYKKQTIELNPDAEIYFDEISNINDGLWYYSLDSISYFDTFKNAIKQAKLELKITD